MKEAVTKVIDTLTQEDLHEASQNLLERYNKCTAAGGDYIEGDKSFMSVLSIKVPIRKKSGDLFNDPRIYIKTYSYNRNFSKLIQNWFMIPPVDCLHFFENIILISRENT